MTTETAPTSSLLSLVKSRRFGPLFYGLCTGAFGDNLLRNAMVILVLFRLAVEQNFDAKPIATLAPGIFMLPFFLFSGTAGQIADKYDKAMLMRRLKLLEIGLMTLAGFALISNNIAYMMGVLFLAGLQSAFYSPLKYAILPQHLGEKDLLSGNAIVGAGTFLSILLGTIAGGALVLLPHGEQLVATLMITLAVIGWLSSLYIPPAPAGMPELALNPNPLDETRSIIKTAFSQPDLPLVILGHAGFWLVATMLVGQMPTVVETVMHAPQSVFTFFFTLFSVGVGAGSLLVRRMLGNTVDGRYVALGTLGLGVGIIALAVTLERFQPVENMTILSLIALPIGQALIVELLAIAVFAGIYIVPLNALLQARATEALRARTIAASNIVDSGAIVISSLIAALLLKLGLGIPMLWILTGLGCLLALPLIASLIPHVLFKQIMQRLLRAAFDVRIDGLEHLENVGPRAVIVANHVSLLDGLLLGAFLPGRPLFAINLFIAQQWWVKPFMALIEAYPLDPTQPLGLKGLIARVSAGAHCVIFPEGRITTTGSLMKINEGPGLIAEKADAPIVAVRIAGAEYTRLSYLKGVVRRRTFPRIHLTILPPQTFKLPEELPARQRRQLAGQKLYDLMSNLIFETSLNDDTLVEALLDARSIHGNKAVLEDKDRRPITYGRIIQGMILLGRKFAKLAPHGGRIGVMLPGVNLTAVTFFALQMYGRTPAMINFTSGAANIRAALTAATVKHIITSRKFIEQAKLEPLVQELERQVTFVYAEDLNISVVDKLWAALSAPFARYLHRRQDVRAEDAAVVLFTSGSEGTPKGVVLSHRNLLANRWQVGSRLDFSPRDIVLNALPLFHSFGLTGGLLIPLLAGAKTVLYPSPLHYRIVPLLAYDCNATILFGTDTFLTGYARTAHPYDFYALRFVCAGAEKVKDETRRIYADRFGVRILEGYGATETSPVVAINTLLHSKAGTVGRLLPGMKARLTAVPGIEDAGRLSVSGPNIMMGYLKVDAPGVIQPPEHDADGHWHDTGDIVSLDSEGYIAIKGRAKRFAKIAGEMISLGGVEELAQRCWPGAAHAVVILPDPRKGEQIILATTKADPQLAELQAMAKAEGQTELMVPKTVLFFAVLPLLGTGKTDYVELLRQVKLTISKPED